jgi:type I restriction enzyme M protein
MLEIGEKYGIIVLDDVFFGSSNAHRDLRKLLLEKCQLEGIVSTPSDVFKPYVGGLDRSYNFHKRWKHGKSLAL